MTVHVLHAGDGYRYLTRQVASGDAVRAKGEGLTDYYAASGNPPGRWVGSGCADLDVEGVVEEEQMRALFGEGRHPRSDEIMAELIAAGASDVEAAAATQLGRRMPVITNDGDHYNRWVEDAFAKFERDHGHPPTPGVEADFLRYTVARRWLSKDQPGVEISDQQVRKFLAERGAKVRQPVSGYDLVFTPPKSISVLWGLGDRDVSRAIEAAHERSWKAALAWLESEAAVTRKGAGGLAQIDTHGFIATAFDHIDSRAGDPNLHTHVAVANRVLGVDGKWRAVDARPLHHLAVAASEHYNLLMEWELTRMGARFHDVYTRRGARPVREIEGIPTGVRELFSKRKQAIETSFETLVEGYKLRHGVMPSKVTQLRLKQEATLATRQGKEEGVTLLERREQWASQLTAHLGGRQRVSDLMRSLLRAERPSASLVIDEAQRDQMAFEVVNRLSQTRSRWHLGHVAAEADRVIRDTIAPLDGGRGLARVEDPRALAADVQQRAYNFHSVSLEAPEILERPAMLSRKNGESQFRVHGAQWRTSTQVLDREDAILKACSVMSGPVFDPRNVDLVASLSTRQLDAGQLDVARYFISSGELITAAIGPAGTGKTTAMRAMAEAVQIGGGRVVGLAPSAQAADVLGRELGTPASTIAKFLKAQERFERRDGEAQGRLDGLTAGDPLRLDPSTIVLIDEAGMASAADILDVVNRAQAAGARVCLIGDPDQLDAVQMAGALRLIEREVGAAYLTEIHRFVNPAETEATLAVRTGDINAAEFYIREGRLHGGTRAENLARIYEGWTADNEAGMQSMMMAYSNEDVATLAGWAQRDRVTAGEVVLTDVELHNGHVVGVGDRVVTRQNDYTIRASDDRPVLNGQQWQVDAVDPHRRLQLTNLETGAKLQLEADYVRAHVELAYATTVHRLQGGTVDRAHVLLSEGLSRQSLYVALTRGRFENHIYANTDELMDIDGHAPIPDGDAAASMLRKVIANDQAELSATETLQRSHDSHNSLATMLEQYEHVQREFAPQVSHDHARDVVMRAFGGAGHYVTDDAATWDRVARVVHDLEQTGQDPVRRLSGLARVDELASDGSAGALIVERVGEIGPGRRTAFPEVNRWLEGMEQRIRERLATDELVALPRGRFLADVRAAWTVAAPEPGEALPTPQERTFERIAQLRERAGALSTPRDDVDVLTPAAATEGAPEAATQARPSLQERAARLRGGPGARTAAQQAIDAGKEIHKVVDDETKRGGPSL